MSHVIPAWWRYGPAPMVLAIGLGLSITAFLMVRHLEAARMRADFNRKAGFQASALSRAVDISVDDLHFIANFLGAHHDVDDLEFRRLVAPSLERQPALLAHLWLRRVSGGQRAAYACIGRPGPCPRRWPYPSRPWNPFRSWPSTTTRRIAGRSTRS